MAILRSLDVFECIHEKPLEGVSPEPKATHLVSPTAWQRGFAEASHHEGHILPKLRRGRNIIRIACRSVKIRSALMSGEAGCTSHMPNISLHNREACRIREKICDVMQAKASRTAQPHESDPKII